MARINHQVLYAKNFYAHSGDIVSDMLNICRLDCNGSIEFNRPEDILDFMVGEYKQWGKETGHKTDTEGVAWCNDPVESMMWAIIISYSCHVPMTKASMPVLPEYGEVSPQYTAREPFAGGTRVFSRSMTDDQLKEAANEIISMRNIDRMDIIADIMTREFPYDKCRRMLKLFGKNVTESDLDDELWTAYSQMIEDIIGDDGDIREGIYCRQTENFSLTISPVTDSTFEIEAWLNPYRIETLTCKINGETFKQQVVECCRNMIEDMESDGAFDMITEASNTDECRDLFDGEVPRHLLEGNCRQACEECFKFIHPNEEMFSHFSEMSGDMVMGISTGCFSTSIFNDGGRARISITFEPIFGCSTFENELISNMRFVSSEKR